LKAATVLMSGFGAPALTDGRFREIDIGFGDDLVVGDKVVETFPGHDDDIGRNAAVKLRANGIGSAALRFSQRHRDRDAGGFFEIRNRRLEGGSKAARGHDFHLGKCPGGEERHKGGENCGTLSPGGCHRPQPLGTTSNAIVVLGSLSRNGMVPCHI
jgi:hypothetical protein